MKKVLAIIMILVLCLALMCGCKDEDSGDDKTVIDVLDKMGATAVQNDTDDVPDTNVDSTKEQTVVDEPVAEGLAAIVAEYVPDIDLLYSVEDDEETHMSFEIIDEEDNTFDSYVRIGGVELMMPCTYADVANAGIDGIEFDVPMDEAYEYEGFDVWINGSMSSYLSFGDFGFEEIDNNSEAELYAVAFDKDGIDAVGGDVDICGITADSDAKDLLMYLGNPCYIIAEEREEGTFVWFTFIDEYDNTLAFEINAADGSISFIQHYYSAYN